MIKSHSLKLLTIGLPLELLLSFSVAADAQPKLKVTSATFPEQIILQENFIPPKEGKPKDTSGAGSRSQLKCSQKEGAIRALMPKENYGLTLQERPTIFIQMPRTSARQVVLMFRDETGEFYKDGRLKAPEEQAHCAVLHSVGQGMKATDAGFSLPPFFLVTSLIIH